MPRTARCVVPGIPHHVTQRGNRRQETFFLLSDYELYKTLLRDYSRRWEVRIWSYCLMPNHIHLILEPSSADGLGRVMGTVHQRYTWIVNRRMGWTGCLWQGRFWSCPMDEHYLCHAARYVLRNPVSGGQVTRPDEWPYSSARAHISGYSDGIVDTAPLAQLIDDWPHFLSTGTDAAKVEKLLEHSRAGLPIGSNAFVSRLEKQFKRPLALRPVGNPAIAKLNQGQT